MQYKRTSPPETILFVTVQFHFNHLFDRTTITWMVIIFYCSRCCYVSNLDVYMSFKDRLHSMWIYKWRHQNTHHKAVCHEQAKLTKYEIHVSNKIIRSSNKSVRINSAPISHRWRTCIIYETNGAVFDFVPSKNCS